MTTNSQVTKEYDAPSQQSFDQFFAANKGLVHKVAIKVFKRVLSMGIAVEYEDIAQEASISMMKCHAGFNPELGFKFSTYYMRAAFNDLNRFLREYSRDVEILQLKSMHAATGEDGESIDMESTIAGNFGTPEQYYEASQLDARLTQDLSPLAKLLLDMTIEPTEELEQEWESSRMGSAESSPAMSFTFVSQFAQKLDPSLTNAELRRARSEITAIAQAYL